MDSQDDNIENPTDSRSGTTMNLPFRDPPLPTVTSASLPNGNPCDVYPFSYTPKERFLEMMSEFYDKTSASADGFSPIDFMCIVESVTSRRHRVSRPDGLYFSNNPARQSIVDHFQQRLLSEWWYWSRERQLYKPLNSALCWAFLQVADMREMNNIDIMLSAPAMPKLFDEFEDIFIAWSLQFRIFFNFPLEPHGPSLMAMLLKYRRGRPTVGPAYEARDSIKQRCLFRDSKRCIITKTRDPEVAYIYPLRGINSPERETLRTAVATIWGQARADEIYHKLFGHGIDGIDCLGNVVCMSPNFRAAWERGDFTLYPRRAERDPEEGGWKMELVFYWLRKLGYSTEWQMERCFRESAAEWFQSREPVLAAYNVRAINVETNAPIIDGDIITVRAFKKGWLPDYDILMLQYDILRMASLCGGAEPDEPVEEDYSVSSEEYGAVTTPEETEDEDMED